MYTEIVLNSNYGTSDHRPPELVQALAPIVSCQRYRLHTANTQTHNHHQAHRKAGPSRSSSVNRPTPKGQSYALSARAGEMQQATNSASTAKSLQTRKHPTASRQPVTPALSVILPVSFRAVSRPLELSLQSSLQLSFTVLVCYRSHGHI